LKNEANYLNFLYSFIYFDSLQPCISQVRQLDSSGKRYIDPTPVAGATVYITINGYGPGSCSLIEPPAPRLQNVKDLAFLETDEKGNFHGYFQYGTYNSIDWMKERTGDGIHDCSGRPVYFDFFVIKEGYTPMFFKGSSEKKYQKTPYTKPVKIEKLPEMNVYSMEPFIIYSLRPKN
jgi:hypothetical protein